MAVVLEIPEEIVQALRLPVSEIPSELKKELAVSLYARGALSIGKAVEFAGITRQEFEAILARRRIERPYDMDEIERDLAWAKGTGVK